MATKIRFKRIGRRNRPFYRMVAMDSRNRRDGAAIEELGWYNPLDSKNLFQLKEDRVLDWLSKGAEPTEAAKKILRQAGIAHRWHLMKQGLNESDIEKEMKKWELNREDVISNRIKKSQEKSKAKTKEVKRNDDENNNDTNILSEADSTSLSDSNTENNLDSSSEEE